jgi:hypothetical protein
MTRQHIDHGLDLQGIQQACMRRGPKPACQRMPPIGRRHEDAFLGDTQQFSQESDLTLEADAGFQQIMASDPVNRLIIKRQPDIFRDGLTIGCIERQPTVFFTVVFRLATTEGDESLLYALVGSLTCAFNHF